MNVDERHSELILLFHMSCVIYIYKLLYIVQDSFDSHVQQDYERLFDSMLRLR